MKIWAITHEPKLTALQTLREPANPRQKDAQPTWAAQFASVPGRVRYNEGMTTPPRSALLLGLAGTLPFLWGLITLAAPDLALWIARTISPRFVGPFVQLSYGMVILAFMSGVLWGFATRTSGGQATLAYVLSVIPALWAFFMTGSGPITAATNLAIGFTGLLVLDWLFWRWQLAPAWWMSLRLLLTFVVVSCLIVGIVL